MSSRISKAARAQNLARAGRKENEGAPRPSRFAGKKLLAASASFLAIAAAAPLATTDARAQQTMRGTELLERGVFRGANMPTVAATNNGFRMTIEQVEPKALIDWRQFNIHADDEVYFKQDSADWIALNRIFDSNPTEIAGRITAKGQVWLMNTNGIVFTETARVNVNTLIATQRPIAELDQYTTQELMARDEQTGDYEVELIPGGLVNSGGDGAAFGYYLEEDISARYGVLPMPGMEADPDYAFEDFDVFWNAASPFFDQYKIADIMAFYVIRKAALQALGEDTRANGFFNETLSGVDASLNPRLEAFIPISYLDQLAADYDVSALSDNQINFWTPTGDFRDFDGFDPVPGISQLTAQGIIPEAELQQLSAEITDFARFRFSDEGRAQIASERADYLANARVIVEEGAQIRTGRAVEGGELGKAILVGTNIENYGRIEGDQVMLLAGERAFFENSVDQGLRGLTATVSADAPGATNDAFDRFYRGDAAPENQFELSAAVFRLDQAAAVGMEVLNDGEIFAARGNVSIVARNITNSGSVAATTGVSGENGSVLLQASHGYQFIGEDINPNLFGGEVTIAEGGEVRVDADDSGATQLEGDVFRNSRVTIQGRTVELESGSQIVAPGAEVELAADAAGAGGFFNNFVDGKADDTGLPARGDDGPAPSVIVRDGAVIDVSGLKDVEFDMDYNVVEIELRSNELADSPLYRDSFVTGEIIRVDRRRGTLFADWTAALNFSQVTAEQLMTAGGDILIQAGGSDDASSVQTDGAIILERGSKIDISGGSRFFRTGTIDVTNFLQPDGRSVNIGGASPLQRYIGFAQTPLRSIEQGYLEGDDAGSLEVKGPRALLFGELDGSVTVGDNQREANLRALRALAPAGAVNTPPEITLPEWGALTLGTTINEQGRLMFDNVHVVRDSDEGAVVTEVDRNGVEYERELVFSEEGVAQIINDNLNGAATAIVSTDFLNGMGDTQLVSGSRRTQINILDGASITTNPGGSFVSTANDQSAGVIVGDNVSITAKGGLIDLGEVASFGDGIRLDASGEWLNEALDGRRNRGVFIDGGAVNFFQERYVFNGDVTIDISGGGWYREIASATQAGSASFSLEEGDGGSIDFRLPDFQQADFNRLTIETGAIGVAGSFAVVIAGDVVIGGDAPDTRPEDSLDWFLGADFFNRNAFSSYAFAVAGDLTVAAGTQIAPQHQTLEFIDTPVSDIASGERLADYGAYVDTPEVLARVDDFGLTVEFPQDPFSISAQSARATVEAGAAIDAGTLGTISFLANYIDMHGSLTARGGRVSLQSNDNPALPADAPAYVRVHDGAAINVDGLAQISRVDTAPNASVRVGRVLGGGDINVSGPIAIIDDTASFSASGAAGVLDLPSLIRGGVVLRGAVDVASDGGSISISGEAGQVLGQYRAAAGGATARGGRFNIQGGAPGESQPGAPNRQEYFDDAFDDSPFAAYDNFLFVASFVTADPADTPNFYLEFFAVLESFFGVPAPDFTADQLVTLGVDLSDVSQSRAFFESVIGGDGGGQSFGSLTLDSALSAGSGDVDPADFSPEAVSDFAINVPPEFAGQEEAFVRTVETFFNVLLIPDFGGPGLLPQGPSGFSGVSLAFNPDRLDGSGVTDVQLSGASRIDLASDIDIAAETSIVVAADVIDLNDYRFDLDTTYMRFTQPAGAEGEAAGASGAGRFTADADLIEFNSIIAFEDAAEATFNALDIRGASPDPDTGLIPVGVDTTGAVTLRAGQIYPSTAQTLVFRSDSEINILPGARGPRPTPLSAGGSLEIAAPVINQGGYVSAPLGQITLNAVGPDGAPGTVNFLEGGVTSTAGNGLEILFGVTRDGVAWDDPRRADLQFNDPERLLTLAPEKRIAIDGAVVDIQDNAVIDTSGGGDIRSFEFTPGIGGRTDYLDNSDGNVFAIVPAYGDIFAPFDPTYDNDGARSDIALAGRKIDIGGGFGLPAGEYVLLPAAYALLDGAYRVRLDPETPFAAPTSSQSPDGSFVTTGRLVTASGGGTIESQTTFAVEISSGETVRLYSEYVEASGNTFFTSEDFVDNAIRQGIDINPAPRRPADGGFLTLAARDTLNLGGLLDSNGLDGARGGVVDIVSENIAIVSRGEATGDLDGFLIIDVEDVNDLGAESVLFGGVRRQSERGLEVRVGADQDDAEPIDNPTRDDAVAADRVLVRTNDDDPLIAPELLFVAINDVVIEDGSTLLTADSAAAPSGEDIILTPTIPQGVRLDGEDVVPDPSLPAQNFSAFLRLSSIEHADVIRDNAVSNEFGNLLIGENVTLGGVDGAAQSLVFNATGNLALGEGAALAADVVAAATTFIAAGEFPADLSAVPGYTDGGGEVRGVLRLTPETLALLGQSGALDLQAFQSIDFFGDAAIALGGDDTAITLTTPMVRGASADARALLSAGEVTLRSIDTLSDTRRAELEAGAIGGAGSVLTIEADTLLLGETALIGDQAFGLELLGFEAVNAAASDGVVFTGEGALRIGGDATFATSRVMTQRTTQYGLESAGDLAFTALQGDDGAEPGVGGILTLTGDNLRLDTLFDLPSGVLIARSSSGDLTVGSNGRILANGAEAQFFELTESLPGGEARLIAEAGDVVLAQGSVIDVSGGEEGGEGGRLTVSAGSGTFIANGDLEGEGGPGADGASITVNVARLDDFGGLAAQLNAAGFNGDRSFALGASDVTIDGVTRARSFRLVTSAGNVTVAGSAAIETAGDGGDIAIYSAGDLDVQSGARLDASAASADGNGGDITLGLGADTANRMSLASGARLDVSGSGSGADGEIRLRAPQIAGDVAIDNADADFVGAPAIVEAYAVTDLGTTGGVSTIDAASIASGEVRAALDAAAAFMAGAGAIEARLGGDVIVTPGVELRSSGDIVLSTDWNLRDERYGGQPGALALRAAGDITLDGNLSDGFVDAARTPDTAATEAEAVSKLTNDRSWSYVIAAGADQAAADPSSVVAPGALPDGAGALTINGLVRTGTGDIVIAAADDITFGADGAGVYTIGVEAAEVADFERNNVLLNQFGNAEFFYYQLFTEGGGDVTLAAGGDIIGHETTNIYDLREWLWFRGAIDAQEVEGARFLPETLTPDALFRFQEDYGQFAQTAIWLMPDRFNGGVATMGGGDVTATAGGATDNLNLASARTLRVAGGTTGTPQKTVHFTGGGDIAATATGDIRGGGVYVSQGEGDIRAGGEIGLSTRTNRSLVLSVGDAAISAQATATAWIDSLFTPFFGNSGLQTPNNIAPQAMVEYTRDSAITVFSSGGDVRLIGGLEAPLLSRRDYLNDPRTSVYPGQITLAAPNGGAALGGVGEAAPVMDAHENTALTVLARDTVRFGDFENRIFAITTGDREYDLTPRILNPVEGAAFVNQYDPYTGYPGSGAVSPDGPYDNTESRNRIYSTEGDIVSAFFSPFQFTANTFGESTFFSNETWFKAAGDFIVQSFGTPMRLQNNHENDLTLIHVGGDVRGAPFAAEFLLEGPGRFEIHAGGDIFVDSVRANEFLRRTSSRFAQGLPLDELDSADLSIMTGINQRPRYEAFADRYFNPALVGRADTPDYLILETDNGAVPFWSDMLVAWAENRSGERGLSVEEAYAFYEATEPEYRTELVLDVFEAEIRLSGREAVGASPDTDPANIRLDDPRRGYIAINALFPGAGRPTEERFDQLDAAAQASLLEVGLGPLTDALLAAGESTWDGELVGVAPLIRTEGESGPGDIQVISPGDNLRLALPSVASTTSETAGVITEDGGNIFVLSYGDLITGQSRIITANTGDILAWSSYGGIDAGSGAQTTLSIPPVLFETDQFGVTTIDRDNPIDGAGIATLFDINGDPGGDIDLYAFNGVVNAGDAGIRASRDLFIGAIEIRGLDNITVGGVTNVDLQVETGDIGPLNLQDFAEAAAERALEEALENVEEVETARSRGRITSELLGLDGCIDADGDGVDDETGGGC